MKSITQVKLCTITQLENRNNYLTLFKIILYHGAQLNMHDFNLFHSVTLFDIEI